MRQETWRSPPLPSTGRRWTREAPSVAGAPLSDARRACPLGPGSASTTTGPAGPGWRRPRDRGRERLGSTPTEPTAPIRHGPRRVANRAGGGTGSIPNLPGDGPTAATGPATAALATPRRTPAEQVSPGSGRRRPILAKPAPPVPGRRPTGRPPPSRGVLCPGSGRCRHTPATSRTSPGSGGSGDERETARGRGSAPSRRREGRKSACGPRGSRGSGTEVRACTGPGEGRPPLRPPTDRPTGRALGRSSRGRCAEAGCRDQWRPVRRPADAHPRAPGAGRGPGRAALPPCRTTGTRRGRP